MYIKGGRGGAAMQIQTLQAFLVLANSSSISDGSRKLNISQQGLSRQLKAMEEELGITLVKRTHHGISLTAAGKTALPFFQQVVDDYQQGIDQLAFYRKGKGEKLRLFVCPGIKQALGLDFFFRFQKENPQVKLDLQFAEDDICEQALLAGNADAAFLDWPHHPEAYRQLLVVRSRLVAVMRSDNPLTRFTPLSMHHLAGVQVYFPDESNYMSQRFRKHWPQFYAEVRRTIFSNDYDSFYRLPQRFGGVALTFQFLCHHLEKGLVAIPVKEPSYVEIFFCQRQDQQPMTGVKKLTQYIKEHVHLIENGE